MTRAAFGTDPLVDVEVQGAVAHADSYPLAWVQPAVQEPPGQLAVQVPLDDPAHRPGAELGLVAVLGDPLDRGRGDLQVDVLRPYPAPALLQHQLGDLAQLRHLQPTED